MPPDTATNDPNARHDGWNTLKRFLPYLWPKDNLGLRWRIVGAVVLILLAKATTLALPYAYKRAVDLMSIKAGPAMEVALALVLAYALGRFAGTAFDNLRNIVFERVGQDAARALAEDVFARLHRLSLRFHLARRTGEVTKVIERGTKSIDAMLYFMLFNIAPTAIELVAVAVIFYLNFGWGLVAATGVAVVAYIWVTRTITEWRTKLREQMNRLDGQALSRAVDSLLNYETVKYFNNEEHEAQRYDVSLRRMEEANVKSYKTLAVLNVGQSAIIALGVTALMYKAAAGVVAGKLSVGDLVLINAYLLQMAMPLNYLGMMYREVKQALANIERLWGLLDEPQEVRDDPAAQPLQTRQARVSFEDVHFSYDRRREILHGVDFEIPPGHRVAVVGHSGSGKSTLARLLYRFYDVDSGSIAIDGQDLRGLSQASLRAAIAIVPQDTVLFNDSIRYNIRYGRPAATDEEVEEAARAAHIHRFILSLPDGYDTAVGERGLKLSGGEKQRVAIARALLKNPAILIFDEATSALDSASEKAIQGELNRIAIGRTTLVIAHRLSTIMDADQILVMDGGNIVERGSHAALVARDGQYAAMWRLQQQRPAESADEVS
jgi:ATP-binding cassette subfamily B protein